MDPNGPAVVNAGNNPRDDAWRVAAAVGRIGLRLVLCVRIIYC